MNVLVGDLTFTRPEQWQWDSPSSNSKAQTRFVVPNESGKHSTTDVRFYLGQKNPAVAAAVWKSYFPNAKPEDITEETKKIGSREVTYVSVSGIYSGPGSKPKGTQTFLGVVIPSGENFVHVRIFGPKGEVQKASALFKKMVEDALQNKESDQ